MSLLSTGLKDETNPHAYRVKYRNFVCRKESKCSRCSMHGGIDNRARRIDRKRCKLSKYRRKHV